jgi:hypothetical protein
MIIDGSRGWYWYLKSLPVRIQKYDIPVRFNIIEREIGSKFNSGSMMVDESDIAYNIMDGDTLLGILFDESLKSKCIAAIDEKWSPMSSIDIIDITIVLVQGGEGHTNIDADVLGSFAKVFQQPH